MTPKSGPRAFGMAEGDIEATEGLQLPSAPERSSQTLRPLPAPTFCLPDLCLGKLGSGIGAQEGLGVSSS